ncbi:transcription factor TFIIIB component B'' homolog [Arapaima gigas]
MMRRLRIAVRPNVRPGGRGLSSTRDAQPVCGSANDDRDHERASQRGGTEGGVQKVAEDQPDEIESSNHAPKNTRCSQPEKDSSNLGGKHQNGEASTCSDQPVSSWQRQKRFCSIPNLTKTRMMLGPTHSSRRTPRSPAKKAVAGPLAEVMTADSEGQLQSNSGSSHDLRSPSRQKASGSGKQAKIEGRPVPLSPASKNQSDSSQGRKLVSKKPLCLEGSSSEGVEKQQDTALSHSRALPPESFPVTAKLSQSTGSFAKVQPPLSTLTSRNQSISFDHTRVMKAHKLRELLKREWRKERKQKKSKSHTFECNAAHDRNKMTMADLIYYLPDTNPMKSYLVDEIKQTEKILPSSPPRNLTEDLQEDDVEDDSQIEDADNDPAQDAQLAVPRVKVAEDGSLIIDEESLTIEVSRVKGPNTVEENDPIFERGSSTTYTSFRKTSYTKPWTDKETDMFFLAISMVGTDFSMIGQLFPHRERAEIKNKFKKEERANSWRIDKAFREKCRFDLSYFNTLLKKSLAEEEKKREKCKPESLIKKTTARKLPSKQKDKNIAPTHQTAEGETDNEVVEMDSEMAEKENEDCSNVIGLTNEEAAFQKKHKARAEEVEVEDSSSERHTNGRKTVNCSNEDDAVDLVTETPASDIDGKRLEAPDLPEGGRKGPVIKPTQLSRGLLQKPLPNLGKHWVKKMMGMKEKPCDEAKTACEHYKEDGATEVSAEAGEYLDKKPRQSKRQARGAVSLKDDEKAQAEDTEDELDLMAVQEQMLNKPTRSGRIPKISQALQQAGEEDSPDECSPTSPPPLSKASPKQQRRRVKPKPNLDMSKKSRGASRSKLVTLRASLPEDCEEEEQNEVRPEEPYSYPINPEEQNQAPAFVPLSLRSPEPVRLEVEESMEELEISVNVPDVLDVEETQGSLCSQSECPDVQEEVTVTTEHQLDLHVIIYAVSILTPWAFVQCSVSPC